MYRGLLLIVCAALGIVCSGCRDNAVIARGGDFVLTPEDLRFEVQNLGPSYDYEDTYESRLALVENLAARHFLAEEAQRRGYGEDGLADEVKRSKSAAVAEVFRKWKIDKSVRVPRIESKQVLDYLNRRIHVKQMLFAVYPVAEEALAQMKSGEPFDSVAAEGSGREDIRVVDHGLKIWKEFDRELATALFPLAAGEFTGIVREKTGYSIYYVSGAEPWDVDPRVIYLRSRRLVRWAGEAELARLAREELRRKYHVRFLEEGVGAALRSFAMVFRNEMPPEDLLNVNMLTYSVGGEEVTYTSGYFFHYYGSLPSTSQPYIGDMHAIEEFALDTILAELQAAAGFELGLDRTREVVWNVKKAREEFLIPKMEDHFGTQVDVSEEEVAAYYRGHESELRTAMEYRIRRILVDSEEGASLVLDELAAGRDFAQVAQERSLDAYSSSKGGDLGYIQAGMFTQYDSLVAGLEPGETTGPFATRAGIEILKLEDKTQPRQMSFEESKGYTENMLRKLKADQLLIGWVAERKEAVGFFINGEALKEIDLPDPGWMAALAKESPEEEEEMEPGAPIKGRKARERDRRRS